MNLPFKSIPYSEKVIDPKTGEEVPNFRWSRFASSCYWEYYMDFKDPQPITDELNNIFDIGTTVHHQDNVLYKGAKCIEATEIEMKIVHEKRLFTMSAHADYVKFDFNGLYIEDMKSCKENAFFYFVKCITNGLSKDYIKQLSGYSFMYYIHKGGVRVEKGVIRRIQKDNTRNQMAIEDNLMSIEKMLKFVKTHPVLLCMLGIIKEDKLIEKCKVQMEGEKWKCSNCSRREMDCPVYPTL